ncbi:MAG: hypothetical protein HQL01_09995 [Nitrospirae bacterium]|nr:hypothetical protein [Nitrospirota bacterium]
MMILLRMSPVNYDFYLCPLSIICYFTFITELLPALIDKYLSIQINTKYYISTISVFFICMIIPIIIKQTNYNRYPESCASYDRGTLCTKNTNDMIMFEFLDYAVKISNDNSTLYVLPEGIAINFILNRGNPSRYYAYMLQEQVFLNDDDYIDEIKNIKYDYKIIVPRIFDNNYRYGINYGVKLVNWILINYELIKEDNLIQDGLGRLLLYKRKT